MENPNCLLHCLEAHATEAKIKQMQVRLRWRTAFIVLLRAHHDTLHPQADQASRHAACVVLKACTHTVQHDTALL